MQNYKSRFKSHVSLGRYQMVMFHSSLCQRAIVEKQAHRKYYFCQAVAIKYGVVQVGVNFVYSHNINFIGKLELTVG